MFKKILVPYDDSPSSQHALANAVEMVDGVDGASIVVLKVVEWHDYNAETFKIASRMSNALGDSLDINTMSEIDNQAESAEAEKLREEISPIIRDFREVGVAIVNGSPHDTIVDYASENDFDCIVMGHRGMGVFRGMLGSVAFSVLQKTTKPVLVVK